MLYFDRPGAVFLILMLVGPILLALAGVRALYGQEPRGWDAIYAMLAELGIIVGTLLVVSAFISQMYDEYKRVNGDNPKPKVNELQSQARTIPNLNAVYEFQGQTVRLDHRRHFFILLWRQYEYDPQQVDLTEEYWLRNQPRKWKGKDSEFRELKHECDGVIFERKDPNRKNSGYVIRNEQALHYAASHGVLPH